MDAWMVLLGWVLFAGTHMGLSAEPFRGGLVSKMGEKGFQGLYSLISFVTFGFVITAYVMSRGESGLFMEQGMDNQIVMSVCNLLMIFSFILLFAGFINGTPMGMAPAKKEAFGITRITRHPMNMAFALFGLSHILTNRSGADWFFYGGFVLYGYFGSLHQDRKKIRQLGDELAAFVATTSIVPFMAIITGKQKLKPGEISKLAILLGVVISLVAKVLHPSVRSQLFS